MMEVRELTLIQLLTCSPELCSLIVSKLIFMVQECPGLMLHSLIMSLQSPWVWSISLCVSWHWHFERIQSSYFVESPSVWVCLMSPVSILVVLWYCQEYHRNDDAFFLVHHPRGKWYQFGLLLMILTLLKVMCATLLCCEVVFFLPLVTIFVGETLLDCKYPITSPAFTQYF